MSSSGKIEDIPVNKGKIQALLEKFFFISYKHHLCFFDGLSNYEGP